MTGLEARRHKKIMTHTALARDAINSAGKSKLGCGILDTDLIAAFDWMVMPWVQLVLAKKGLCEEAISRISNLYSDSVSLVVVNNMLGRTIGNVRQSIRHGDKASMEWFTYGIDPILTYLEKRLTGILIYSLPVQGPLPMPPSPPLSPKEQR